MEDVWECGLSLMCAMNAGDLGGHRSLVRILDGDF